MVSSKTKNIAGRPPFRVTFHGLEKFAVLLLILGGYAAYVIEKFGLSEGIGVTLLTWAFFVTCTPIADAGFLVDFPVRVLFKFKMIWSEIIVWSVAATIIAYTFIFQFELFDKIEILRIFDNILTHPWPMWTLILISAVGTFLSIYIGDQVYAMVRARQHHRHIRRLQIKRFLFETGVFALVVVLYAAMLEMSHISIS